MFRVLERIIMLILYSVHHSIVVTIIFWRPSYSVGLPINRGKLSTMSVNVQYAAYILVF